MTAPTKHALPTAEQPPAPTPYGDDIEEAARQLAEHARRDVAGQDPLDRYDSLLWWRLVHVRAAELLHDGRGEPLAELATRHTYREIEALLAEQGTPVSDSTITKLIRAWKQWTAAAKQR